MIAKKVGFQKIWSMKAFCVKTMKNGSVWFTSASFLTDCIKSFENVTSGLSNVTEKNPLTQQGTSILETNFQSANL